MPKIKPSQLEPTVRVTKVGYQTQVDWLAGLDHAIVRAMVNAALRRRYGQRGLGAEFDALVARGHPAQRLAVDRLMITLSDDEVQSALVAAERAGALIRVKKWPWQE